MTDKEALDKLGLPYGSSEDLIEQRYHELAFKHHPDRNNGDAGRMAEINEAHDALTKDRSTAQLAQIDLNELGLVIGKAVERPEQLRRRHEDADKAAGKVKIRATNYLRLLRRNVLVLGSVPTGIVLLSTSNETIDRALHNFARDNLPTAICNIIMMPSAVIFAVAASALMAGLASYLIPIISQAVDDVNEILSDKGSYVHFLAASCSISPSDEGFSREQLLKSISDLVNFPAGRRRNPVRGSRWLRILLGGFVPPEMSQEGRTYVV